MSDRHQGDVLAVGLELISWGYRGGSPTAVQA